MQNGSVDPRERKAILGEGGVRDPNPPEDATRRVLEFDLEGSPLQGKPLPRRLRGGYSFSIDAHIASLGGPRPYMLRLREIESEIERPEAFARRWREAAERWSFYSVNDLIDRHNRFYPAEARLPMDPRTQDFVLVNGEHYERKPLDARWILERFPPALDAETEAAA